MKSERFILQQVHFMPTNLESGVLYVSVEFDTAAHLCACGCEKKIRTPLGPTDWKVWITPAGPTLRPSIGNWQQNCRSHYLITKGRVRWADQWSEEKILAGRKIEKLRRKEYYEDLYQGNGWLSQSWNWLKSLLKN